ncbi:MAG TPA: FliM/FliN family flagellar motor switch protein [Polyangiaceae bacterium]|nr:FliM/FliN family flagellar motor switch protein [Polyangiaceae bacterium]
MSPASSQPFPWKSLEAMTRSDVSAFTELRRRVAQHVQLDALSAALTELVGEPVRLLPGRASRAGTHAPRAIARGLDAGIGVALAPADGDALRDGALLVMESALASAVVARVLRRPPPAAVNLTTPPSPALAGAVAAVIVAAARRAQASVSPLRVVSAGAATVLEPEFVGSEPDTLALSLTVLVGDDAYAARVVLRGTPALSAPPAAWDARALSSLGTVPIALPVVACASIAQLADIAALRVGDVWLPGTWPLELVRDGGASASLRGPVLLAAPGGPCGARARLVEDGRLVLSGEADDVCAAEAGMTEPYGEGALLEAVGDVPVVVRVEIGEAQMTARDWASLRRGDVITLGRRVGEQVVLRVGGVAIARGELVNVDGEVGVRIAERVAGDVTSA